MAPKLLLIDPTMTANGQRLPNAGGMATIEPLDLAYVAALTPPHRDVRIVDDVTEEIPSGYEPDPVGLSLLSITVPRAYESARQCRLHRVPVVMGRVHATLLPEDVEPYVDVAFRGRPCGAGHPSSVTTRPAPGAAP